MSSPAALLVFLPAATGAGIVPADLRRLSSHLLRRHELAIFEIPAVFDFFENRSFMMPHLITLDGKTGDKFDNSLIVCGTSHFGEDDVDAVPDRVFGPGRGTLFVPIIAEVGVDCLIDVRDLLHGMGAVAGTHELLRRFRKALAFDESFATLLIGLTRAAWTIH